MTKATTKTVYLSKTSCLEDIRTTDLLLQQIKAPVGAACKPVFDKATVDIVSTLGTRSITLAAFMGFHKVPGKTMQSKIIKTCKTTFMWRPALASHHHALYEILAIAHYLKAFFDEYLELDDINKLAVFKSADGAYTANCLTQVSAVALQGWAARAITMSDTFDKRSKVGRDEDETALFLGAPQQALDNLVSHATSAINAYGWVVTTLAKTRWKAVTPPPTKPD